MPRLFLALLMLALPASAREISGSLSYPARIALPDGAELVVELAGEGGLAGQLREPTGGRQVPLPFALTVTDDGALTLGAAVFVDGKPLWTAVGVTVPAGTADLDLGTITMAREAGRGDLLRLDCGGTGVEVAFVGDHARLRVDGRLVDLPPAPAASGIRYSDGKTPVTEFRSKGDSARVTLEGRTLPDCTHAAPPGLLPLTARGNEPGWVLSLGDEGMTLSSEDGTRLTDPLPPSSPAQGGGLRFDGTTMVVTVGDGVCRDSMTGMPYPHPVTVETGGRSLTGCGGDPAALLAGRWRLLSAGDETLPDEADITFDGDRVAGRAACNRFSGGFTLTGEGLSFGAMATTRMACPGGLMQAEAAVLGAFGKVDRFDISDQGHLLLMAGERVLIEAAR